MKMKKITKKYTLDKDASMKPPFLVWMKPVFARSVDVFILTFLHI